MSIENKVDGGIARVDAERRDETFGLEKLGRALQYLPPPFSTIAGCVINALRYDRVEQLEYLIRNFGEELKRLDINVDNLSSEQKRHLDEDHPELLRDAVIKAATVRGNERVKWLGRILAHGLLEEPSKTPDFTEELMRIAIALDPVDILVLQQIVYSQRAVMEQNSWNTVVDEINKAWSVATPKINGAPTSDLYSVCVKLEGFGLLMRVERVTSVLGVNVTPFSLLKKGASFLDYIRFNAD